MGFGGLCLDHFFCCLAGCLCAIRRLAGAVCSASLTDFLYLSRHEQFHVRLRLLRFHLERFALEFGHLHQRAEQDLGPVVAFALVRFDRGIDRHVEAGEKGRSLASSVQVSASKCDVRV